MRIGLVRTSGVVIFHRLLHWQQDAVRRRHFVRRTVQSAFRAGAVIAGYVDDQRVVKLALATDLLGKDGRATPLAKFAQAVAVNLNGVFNVMSKCVEQMARSEPEGGEERGVVINISSGAAYEGQVGQCSYSASKAALIGLNMPASRELGAIGVRVNAIAPGLFLTPMAAGLNDNVLASLMQQVEAPRRLGDMREFAHCCAFIIENGYLNAETIRLDAASRLRGR